MLRHQGAAVDVPSAQAMDGTHRDCNRSHTYHSNSSPAGQGRAPGQKAGSWGHMGSDRREPATGGKGHNSSSLLEVRLNQAAEVWADSSSERTCEDQQVGTSCPLPTSCGAQMHRRHIHSHATAGPSSEGGTGSSQGNTRHMPSGRCEDSTSDTVAQRDAAGTAHQSIHSKGSVHGSRGYGGCRADLEAPEHVVVEGVKDGDESAGSSSGEAPWTAWHQVQLWRHWPLAIGICMGLVGMTLFNCECRMAAARACMNTQCILLVFSLHWPLRYTVPAGMT